MTLTVLFAPPPDQLAAYRAALMAGFAAEGVDAQIVTEAADPARVDYIIYAPDSALRDFTAFTGCKAVLNLWAGVEAIVDNPTLTQPLCRMVDPALTQGMVDYVCGHVLRYHLGLDAHIHARPGDWHRQVPPLASERQVVILGLGALGRACAGALAGLGFDVHGWSRHPRTLPGVTCHSGTEGLAACLAQAQILVTLLPLTAETEGLINARTLAQMPRGAMLINPGRGALIEDDALLAALDSGQIGAATLDVFRIEPLPADHPFWAHEGITVTPHIAAATRAPTAARVVARNIALAEAGKPLLYQVNRTLGY